MRLAPTFDHGAALARNLQDSEQAKRLSSKDKNRQLDAFVKRGRSALYDSIASAKPLLLLDAFHAIQNRTPVAAKVWLQRLQQVTPNQIATILAKIPSNRMSDVTKEFTLQFLAANMLRLLA